MSIEDRSLDASKEEGTATVIDGSDAELSERGPFRLSSKCGAGFLHIDGNKSLRADGNKSDPDTSFELHITGTEGEDPIVILQHSKTERVVAIDANDDVITKDPPPGTSEVSDLKMATLKNNHSDILFLKRQREGGSKLFYLESYRRDKKRVLGFEADGSLKKPTVVERGKPESLLEIHCIECPNT